MRIAQLQITPWEPMINVDASFLADAEKDDYLIIETESGYELVKLKAFINEPEASKIIPTETFKGFDRKATAKDLKQLLDFERNKPEILSNCKRLIVKYDLPMKLVDAHLSFDEKRLTFAFIADGRVDFRALVKDLIAFYSKNIRLQQIGVRDETRLCGGLGACGREFCCKRWLETPGGVNAEMAEAQQISHRGADRLLGVCNRLRCCLRYEQNVYEEIIRTFPRLDAEVKTPKGKGIVLSWHVLKKTVSVRIDSETILEVPVKDLKY